MTFDYNELGRYVISDCERFCKWGFSPLQLYNAVLDEYRFAEDFSETERICIQVMISLFLSEKYSYSDVPVISFRTDEIYRAKAELNGEGIRLEEDMAKLFKAGILEVKNEENGIPSGFGSGCRSGFGLLS